MKKRILFVDDEPNLLQGLHRMLRPMSEVWDMSFAGNGLEAMKYMAHTPCDVVATDIVMPEKEGLETIMQLRREYPETRIVAFSGGGRTGKLISALDVAKKLGAHRTLEKPFEPQELIDAVTEVLQDQEAPGPASG